MCGERSPLLGVRPFGRRSPFTRPLHRGEQEHFGLLLVRKRTARTHPPLEGEEDVGGLEVPVHDPLVVHVADGSADLEGVAGRQQRAQRRRRNSRSIQ